MDQIITLLTNLFNLTKVAAVTLPGLLTAGGLALILWPPTPIDVIPVVVAVSRTPETVLPYNLPNATSPVVNHRIQQTATASTFPSPYVAACRVEHWTPDSDDDTRQLREELNASSQVTDEIPYDAAWAQEQFDQLTRVEEQVNHLWIPQTRRRRILEQFALDLAAHNLAICIDTEKSWQGQEQREIQQWTSDLDHLETQRSAAQDNLIAYRKSNNGTLAAHYEELMATLQDRIDTLRNSIRGQNRDVQERARRISELSAEQSAVGERLTDPGRLRPRVGFDLFVTGLVSHIVGFILLSLAAAIVVTAIDRAVFGALWEDLFDGF